MSVAASSTSTKRAKLWKRTWVGSTIAAVLALVLWAASVLDSALPVLGVALAVLAVCIWEVDRMGALRGRKLGATLGCAALAVSALSYAWLSAVDQPLHDHDAGFGALWLPTALGVSALTSLIAFALLRTSSLVVRGAALLVVVLVIAAQFDDVEWLLFVIGVLSLFLALRLFLVGAERRTEALGTILLGAVLVASIPALAWVWYGCSHWGLVALLVICKLGDTAGYYVGSTLGRHHPFPSISPGKTSEGCIGSLVAGTLAGAGAVAIGWLPSEPYGPIGGALAGAAVNVAAQASDLLESWVKRRAGVKDSGNWFGPSGGMLDLVDSFFLAAPVALVVWPILLEFTGS